jgi:hypothetical protein
MISSRNTLATIFLASSLVFPFSALAAVIVNDWTEFQQYIPNDTACGDATGFVLEGMAHEKVSTLRNGQFAVNVNVMGTFTAVDGQYAGEAAIFRQNINDVFPIWEEGVNRVWTIGETTKVITKGQVENYRLNYNFHVTFIDGEVKSFFETEKVTCR